jgi:hypothetical protein
MNFKQLSNEQVAQAERALAFVDTFAELLGEIGAERFKQHEKWGEQNHPDGTGARFMGTLRNAHQQRCKENAEAGKVTYLDILLEEVYEAAAESDRTKLRKELIQVAAVCVQWVQKLDREQDRQPPGSCL